VGAPRVAGDYKITLVPQVSDKKDVRSDLNGDRNTSDVKCECRVPEAYGVPCLPTLMLWGHIYIFNCDATIHVCISIQLYI